MGKKEPKRPTTVPAEAVWNASENEWESGKKNKKGNNIGEWKWWLAPKGHLVCHTFFDNKGNIETFKRFHPNGEISQYGKGKNGKFIERVWQRSTEETTDGFPVYHDYVWKAAQRCGEIPVEYDHYDKEGNHLNKKIEIADDLKNAPENETAEGALNRFEKLIAIIKKSQHKDDESLKEYSKPFYFQKIDIEEIHTAEKRLNIKFPKSYTEFITKHGLFRLGEDNENYSRLLHPSEIIKLSDALENEWEVSWKDFEPKAKEFMDNIYCFSMGDEQLQMCWYHCFNYNSLNEKTGEVQVLDYDQSDWAWMFDKNEICTYKGFDGHISTVVDNEIIWILDE